MIVAADFGDVDGNHGRQHLVHPDFARFKSACAEQGSTAGLVIFRGAWGTSPDSDLHSDWKRAESEGLVCGAYLFLRMAPGAPPPEDQVHVFADNVGSLTAANLVPTIDVEDVGPSAEAELELVHRAWTTMRSIYRASPMLYLSKRVWTEDLHDLPAGELTDSPLWLAKPWPWAVHTPAQLSWAPFQSGALDPPVPTPWGPNNWWLHQYQGDAFPVPGFLNTVDLSRFHLMLRNELGERVKWVQRRLGIPPIGDFDAVMEIKLRAFQRASGLQADAVIGPRTFAALSWCGGVEQDSAPRAIEDTSFGPYR
jgi:GH25 family lysozyme M1 (1,4-beta-N-acetylmuramidase)